MTVASEYDNSSAVVEIAGGNMHMKMSFMGVDMDIYNIDGVMYTLDSESKRITLLIWKNLSTISRVR